MNLIVTLFTYQFKCTRNSQIININLPSELPRDSSTEFSEGIINEVLPFLLKEDDGRILNGTITTDGSFLEKYNYLNDYIRINE